MLQIINLVVSTVMLPSIRSRSAFNFNSASFACVLSFSSCLYGSSSALLHIWQTCGVTCVNQNLKCMVYKGSRCTSCWQLVWNAKIVLERSLNPLVYLDKWPDFFDVLLSVFGEERGKLAFLNHSMRVICLSEFRHLENQHFFAVFNLASLSARHHSL